MAGLQVENLADLPSERLQAILTRSQEDVSQVFDAVRPILAALKEHGDQESVRQHRQFKSDLTPAGL